MARGLGEGTTATGAIVRRLIYEAALQINEASGDQLWPQITQTTIMFGEDDSDSNATPIQSDPVFAPIGQDLLEGLQTPLRNGGLFLRLHPDLTQVFCYLRSAYGNDKTGTSFGAGVVRFQGDTNILVRAEGVPSAPRRSFKKTKAKYLIVGTGNNREIVTNPDPPAYNSYAGLNTDSEDSDDYSAIGTAEHVRRNAASDVVRFAAKTGTTPNSGFYTPRDDVDLGDLCTLDSGGSVDFDWDDSDMQLAAHEFRERDGGGFYWVPEFGAIYTSARAAAIAGAVGGVRSGDCNCLRLCSISLPAEGDTEYWSVDYATGDDDWTEPCGDTTANFAGPWSSELHGCAEMGGARILSGGAWYDFIPATDTELTLTLRVARRGAETGASYLYVDYSTEAACGTPGSAPSETFLISPVGYGFQDDCSHNHWTDVVVTLTPPAGATMVRLQFSFDGAIQSGSLTGGATGFAGIVGDCPEDVGETCDPGTGSKAARCDHVHAHGLRDESGHDISRLRRNLTNNSGGDLTAGAVVVLDGSGFTTTSTAASAVGMVGILLDDTTDGSDGRVQFISPQTDLALPAGVTGASADDYLFTSRHAGRGNRRRHAGRWCLRSHPGGGRLGRADAGGTVGAAGRQRSQPSSGESTKWADTLLGQRFLIGLHGGDIGNNGDSGDSWPQNSLEGHRQGALKGADYADIDCRLTSDGVWVAFHDSSISACTNGSGNVSSITSTTFLAAKFDSTACEGYNASRHGTSVGTTTLEAVLDACRPYGMAFLFECKPTDTASATSLAEFVVAQDWVERGYIHVQNDAQAAAVKAVDSRIMVGINSGDLPTVGADIFSIAHSSVSSLSTITAYAPLIPSSNMPIADFGDPEETIIQNMYDRGIRMWTTNNLDAALAKRASIYAAENLFPTEGVTDHGGTDRADR